MTDRTPEQNPSGAIGEHIPHSGKLPTNQGKEMPVFDFGGISLRDAIEAGLVHYVEKDPETGEVTTDIPDTLADVRDPSKSTPTEHHVSLTGSEALPKRNIGKIAGVVAGLAAIGGGAWWLASANTAASKPSPAASAPVVPASPNQQQPNPAPSTGETAPNTPQLPFDPERVALMKKETADEFYENNGRMLRIQYVLSELYDQVNVRSDYRQMLDQELPNGKTLSDYNPFKEISLTAEADPQDVMDSYVFGWIYAVAHKDPDEGLKMLSTVVRDPKSPFFKDLRTLVEENAGTKVDESIVKKSYYKALSSKRYEKDGETHLSIITEGGFKYEFAFTPVEGLAAVNENAEDNDKEVGVWQGLSSKMGKVTINF